MYALGKNWFIEPAIDFELKKYRLLAYLQQAERQLSQKTLFPLVEDLSGQVNNLETYIQRRNELEQMLRKTPEGLDFASGKLLYANENPVSEELKEINRIVTYSYKKLVKWQEKAQELVTKYRQGISISPVGLLPLYKKEGYLFLLREKTISVFDYAIYEVYSHARSNTFSVQTRALGEFPDSPGLTFEKLKHEITREEGKYASPATFVCESATSLPIYETLLPLAQQALALYVYR